MPIIIPKDLPAYEILSNENIFVMPDVRAEQQDIRPIEIAIVNLMPTKIDTETQLMRLLGNSSLQINVTLISMESYSCKNTPQSHMDKFYKSFEEVKNHSFDGMIITGAPVEQMSFEDVNYWQELTQIMDFADANVTSTIFICWGAQAAMHYHYGIDKTALDSKLFGIFPCQICDEYELLLKGMDDIIHIPMSRYTTIDSQTIASNSALKILAYGDDCGVAICKSLDNKQFYFFGHSEYDKTTLKNEYIRDIDKGLNIDQPVNYFVNDNINNIQVSWRSTANLLFYNWLNYYVYQVTPFNLKAVLKK